MFFDIHSHILPGVDDGAKDMEEALALLKLMKKSGISYALATPHFYPAQTNYDEFLTVTDEVFNSLKNQIKDKKLPEIYLGCEMLYYSGIGISDVLGALCLNKSKFLLLELTDYDINDGLYKDILNLKENKNIIPIIAHIERYSRARNFKKLLQFLKANDIPVQINAASVMMRGYKRVIKNIFKNDLFCVLATDTHSVEERPPLMKEAYTLIRDNFGGEYRKKLVKNAERLREEIIGETSEK